MVSPDEVATSKSIQQRTGKTFHVATRLLPERVRHPTYVLYAFFRVADDVVDDPGDATPDEQRRELARIREAVLGDETPDDPVLAAFRELKETNAISDDEVATFVDAMEMDVDPSGFDTYDDLETYLRGSAVAVGNMMLDVMATAYEMPADRVERARPHARALGEAFQLTNFLRDVREDVRDHGRIYLPRETLDRYGVDEAELWNCEFSERFAAALRAELERTEELYRDGVAGIRYLPADCRFAVLLAAVLYADHHRLIRERGFDTLSARPTLSTRRRLALVAKTWYHWRRTGDPEDAFYAASAVPRVGDDAETPGERGRGDAACPAARKARTRASDAVGAVTSRFEVFGE